MVGKGAGGRGSAGERRGFSKSCWEVGRAAQNGEATLFPSALCLSPGPRASPLWNPRWPALLAGAGPLEIHPSLFPGPSLSLSQRSVPRQPDVMTRTLVSGWVLTWAWPLLGEVPSAIYVSVFSSVKEMRTSWRCYEDSVNERTVPHLAQCLVPRKCSIHRSYWWLSH